MKSGRKTNPLSTIKRLFKNYDKTCKNDNLNQLLNWKVMNEQTKIEIGDIVDPILPIIERENIKDPNFPKIIQDNFTNSLYDKDNKLKTEVLKEGKTIQIWKLLKLNVGILDKIKNLDWKYETWHVSCVIWHNGEPYSFGFDMDDTSDNLVMRTPCMYLELNLIKQKRKQLAKYCDLLAMGTLDTTMIYNLTGLLNSSDNINNKEINVIINGFKPKNEALTAYGNDLKKLTRVRSARGLSYIIKNWTHEPMVLTFKETRVLFKDLLYCRKDPSRKSSKKNCMGTLDTLFQDIFSCRLFGTLIIPKLCGPKKKCFYKKSKQRMTELGGGSSRRSKHT
jgi:hypothetical protein